MYKYTYTHLYTFIQEPLYIYISASIFITHITTHDTYISTCKIRKPKNNKNSLILWIIILFLKNNGGKRL